MSVNHSEISSFIWSVWNDLLPIGYEITFTKYFYQYKQLHSLTEITKDLLDLEKESDGLINKLLN